MIIKSTKHYRQLRLSLIQFTMELGTCVKNIDRITYQMGKIFTILTVSQLNHDSNYQTKRVETRHYFPIEIKTFLYETLSKGHSYVLLTNFTSYLPTVSALVYLIDYVHICFSNSVIEIRKTKNLNMYFMDRFMKS